MKFRLLRGISFTVSAVGIAIFYMGGSVRTRYDIGSNVSGVRNNQIDGYSSHGSLLQLFETR